MNTSIWPLNRRLFERKFFQKLQGPEWIYSYGRAARRTMELSASRVVSRILAVRLKPVAYVGCGSSEPGPLVRVEKGYKIEGACSENGPVYTSYLDALLLPRFPSSRRFPLLFAGASSHGNAGWEIRRHRGGVF